MPALKPLSAFGAETARSLRHGTFTMEENDTVALASLALQRGAALPKPFGLELPRPGYWAKGQGVAALCSAPEQWLLEAHGRAETDFATEVRAECPGCSVTEQTNGFVVCEVRSSSGEQAILALLSKLVNIDPKHLPSGSAIRTGLEHMGVTVVRRSLDHIAFFGMRSAAGTIWHALETAILHQEDVRR